MPEPTQPPTPQRAVYYTRIAVATPEGAQRLVANTAHARARIAAHPEWALIQIVTDTGSGLRLHPGICQLLGQAHIHQVDLVLVDQLSDLGRSTPMLARVLTELDDCGVALSTLDDALHTATPTGRSVARISVLLAEYEQATDRQRRAERNRTASEDC